MARYGLSTWIVAELPLDEAIEALVASGFAQVELSADRSALVKAWEADPESVSARMVGLGFSLPSVHSPEPGRFLDARDEAEREASIAANLRYFDRMKACDIPEIVIHPISADWAALGEPRQVAWERIIDALSRLAERAGAMGLRMAVENLGADPALGASTASLLEMIAGLGDHVGLCLDIGHTVLAGLDPVAEWRTAVSVRKAFSLHLHDVDDRNRDHFVPGEGRVDFEAFLSEVDRAEFNGGRILEISPPASNVGDRLREVSSVRRRWEAR
jgi:sugar phosphate isomerase/epimerase